MHGRTWSQCSSNLGAGTDRYRITFPRNRKSVVAHERLFSNMIALREAINADEEFVVFKTIVGFKSIFPHQWEEERRDFNRDEIHSKSAPNMNSPTASHMRTGQSGRRDWKPPPV